MSFSLARAGTEQATLVAVLLAPETRGSILVQGRAAARAALLPWTGTVWVLGTDKTDVSPK